MSLFISCSKSDINSPVCKEPSKNEKMLLKNPEIKKELVTLMQFNESLLKERSMETRAAWFGRLAATVSADALGAYGGFKVSVGVAAFITATTGGTAGPAAGVAVIAATAFISGGASYQAYECLRSSSIEEELQYIPYKNIDITRIYNNLDNFPTNSDINSLIYQSHSYNHVGYLHNQYLKNLLSDIPRTGSTVKSATSSEDDFFSKEQLDQMYSSVIGHINNYVVGGYDYDDCISKTI